MIISLILIAVGALAIYHASKRFNSLKDYKWIGLGLIGVFLISLAV